MQFPGTRTLLAVGAWQRRTWTAALLYTVIPVLVGGCSAVVAHKIHEPSDRDAALQDADATNHSDAEADAQDAATEQDALGEPTIVSIINEKGDDIYPAGQVVSGELLTITVKDFGDQVTLSGLGDLNETLPVDTTDSTIVFRVPTKLVPGPFQLKLARSDQHVATADLTLIRYVLLNVNRDTIAMAWDGETLDATGAINVGTSCTAAAEELRLSPDGAWAYRRCQGNQISAIYLPTLGATTGTNIKAKKLAHIGWYPSSGIQNPLTGPWTDRFVLSVTKSVTKYRQAICTASWDPSNKAATLNCQQTWTGLDDMTDPMYAVFPTDATMLGVIDNGNPSAATIYEGASSHNVTNSQSQTFLFTPGAPPLCHPSGDACYLADKANQPSSIAAANMTTGILLGNSASWSGCPPATLLPRPDGQGVVAIVRMADQAPSGMSSLVVLEFSQADQAPTVQSQPLGITGIATDATWVWLKAPNHWYAMTWAKNTSPTHPTWFQMISDDGTLTGSVTPVAQPHEFLSVAPMPDGSGILFGIVKTGANTTDLDQCTFEETPAIGLTCHAIDGLAGLKKAALVQP
ncbi:MAG: hypothetical protein J7M25_07550 [Deltaproteobacteria bacterium]|nr:hypothetical protein [Deltaproteobacteria bacterium]